MAATLRLTDKLATQLALMARVEGKSQAEIVREAIAERFETLSTIPDFGRRLEQLHVEDREQLGATGSARLGTEP